MPNYDYSSSLLDFSEAPDEILRILKIWQDHKPVQGNPYKSEMDPLRYRKHLGRFCVVEIQKDPLDFIYRLDGTEISSSSNEDLRGKSVLDGTPGEIYQNHFEEFQKTFEASIPQIWKIFYREAEACHYLRLILPFAENDAAPEDSPSYFMTYCYSLLSPEGHFKASRPSTSNI